MLKKLSRETLVEQAERNLLTFIDTQGLKPGDLLPSEGKLAADFGVSRPVIRETLKSLAGKGVIAIANGKGALVQPVNSSPLRQFFQRALLADREAIVELMEVRRGIEALSVELAARRRTPEQVARMADLVAAMRVHLADSDAYTELDVELHLLIAAAAHNTMLYHLVESLRDVLKGSIREGLRRRQTGAELERVQIHHEAILSAIQSGDAKQAIGAMAAHFDEAMRVLG
jgi:GntR family transcriptional regulator, transcriptional repressor for pyruvate dehydrogenase complex